LFFPFLASVCTGSKREGQLTAAGAWDACARAPVRARTRRGAAGGVARQVCGGAARGTRGHAQAAHATASRPAHQHAAQEALAGQAEN